MTYTKLIATGRKPASGAGDTAEDPVISKAEALFGAGDTGALVELLMYREKKQGPEAAARILDRLFAIDAGQAYDVWRALSLRNTECLTRCRPETIWAVCREIILSREDGFNSAAEFLDRLEPAKIRRVMSCQQNVFTFNALTYMLHQKNPNRFSNTKEFLSPGNDRQLQSSAAAAKDLSVKVARPKIKQMQRLFNRFHLLQSPRSGEMPTMYDLEDTVFLTSCSSETVRDICHDLILTRQNGFGVAADFLARIGIDTIADAFSGYERIKTLGTLMLVLFRKAPEKAVSVLTRLQEEYVVRMLSEVEDREAAAELWKAYMLKKTGQGYVM